VSRKIDPIFFGADGDLRAIERDFADILARYDVGLSPACGGADDVNLVRAGRVYDLQLHRKIDLPEMREAAGIQLGLLHFGHLAPDAPPWWHDADYERSNRRRWRAALLWASRYLVHERTLADAIREGWTVERLAHECQVTERVAGVRMREAAGQAPFFSV